MPFFEVDLYIYMSIILHVYSHTRRAVPAASSGSTVTQVLHAHHTHAIMSSPGEWYSALPVVMRTWGVSCVATTCAVSTGLISPYLITLDWVLLFKRFQVSRGYRR